MESSWATREMNDAVISVTRRIVRREDMSVQRCAECPRLFAPRIERVRLASCSIDTYETEAP